MPKVALYNMKGENIGEIELNDSIFGVEVSMSAMHAAVKNFLANQRQGTQSSLTRTEVSGGGRKPWKQKGTGRARQGSTRAPQWRHGGVVFAPKPRDYRYSLNKKFKRLALKSALTTKVNEENIVVLDSLTFDDIKTKNMIAVLKALGVEGKAMLVTAASDEKIVKSARNIPGIMTRPADTINTYDILNHVKFIVTKDAIDKIQEVFA